MEVTFYSGFSKRVNSTKRPSGGTSININIKDKCDLHRPVIKLNGQAGQYNYFKINDTYFYVDGEVVMPSGWVEISGSPDAMATCADDIKATSAFVIRSSAGSIDLLDSYAPPLTTGTIVYEAEQTVFPISATGTYIVSIADAVAPVAMTLANIISLFNALNSKDATQQIANTYSDLSGYVRGAFWIPFSVPTLGSITLKAGTYDTGISANIISTETTDKVLNFALPLDNTSLTSSQYCSLKISLPFAGTASLSVDDFKDGKSVNVIATLDNMSGNISYYITSGSNLMPIASFSGTSAVPITLGSTSYSLSGGVSGFVSGLAYALSNGNGNAFFQASHSASQTGGGGYRTSILSASVGLIKHEPPEPLANKASRVGLPTYRTMSLSSVNGFVICQNASISSVHEKDLVEQCNNYLNSGAYIE